MCSHAAAGVRPSLSKRWFLRDPSFPVRQGDGDLAADLADFEVADRVGNAGQSGGAVDDRDDGCRFEVLGQLQPTSAATRSTTRPSPTLSPLPMRWPSWR
jgi:hypothetical protein